MPGLQVSLNWNYLPSLQVGVARNWCYRFILTAITSQEQRRSAPDLALLPDSVELQVESSARPSILKVCHLLIAIWNLTTVTHSIQTFVISRAVGEGQGELRAARTAAALTPRRRTRRKTLHWYGEKMLLYFFHKQPFRWVKRGQWEWWQNSQMFNCQTPASLSANYS